MFSAILVSSRIAFLTTAVPMARLKGVLTHRVLLFARPAISFIMLKDSYPSEFPYDIKIVAHLSIALKLVTVLSPIPLISFEMDFSPFWYLSTFSVISYSISFSFPSFFGNTLFAHLFDCSIDFAVVVAGREAS